MLPPIDSRPSSPLDNPARLLDAAAGINSAKGPATEAGAKNSAGEPLKEAFQDFVGQTFFSEMIKALRSTQQPSEYMHGGRTEEIFQSQLDQVLTEELSDSSAEKFADPMFELFMLKRQP